MKLPGFDAETSLKTNTTGYRYRTSAASVATQSINGGVFPSLQRVSTTGCGACTELRWPNGTGTGACVQDCCDLLGHCEIKACTCGSGSGFSSAARSFSAGSFLAHR